MMPRATIDFITESVAIIYAVIFSRAKSMRSFQWKGRRKSKVGRFMVFMVFVFKALDAIWWEEEEE